MDDDARLNRLEQAQRAQAEEDYRAFAAARPLDGGRDALLERLDELEAAERPRRERSPLRRRGAPWWLVGGQAAALVSVIVLAMLQPAAPEQTRQGAYRVLSDAAETGPSLGQTAQLRVVFASDVSERQLRAVLLAAKAEIRRGPTPAGVYTVAPGEGAGVDWAREGLAALRSASEVAFVEATATERAR